MIVVLYLEGTKNEGGSSKEVTTLSLVFFAPKEDIGLSYTSNLDQYLMLKHTTTVYITRPIATSNTNAAINIHFFPVDLVSNNYSHIGTRLNLDEGNTQYKFKTIAN